MAFGNHVAVKCFMYGPLMASPFSVRLWWKLTGGTFDPAKLQAYANELEEFVRDDFLAVLTTDVFFGPCECRFQDGANEYIMQSSNASEAGTVSGVEKLPEEDCVVIRRSTGDTARNKRGRIFVPLVPETFQNDGRLTAGAIVAYKAVAAMLRAVPSGEEIDASALVYQGATPNWEDEELTPIIGTSVVLDVHNRRDRRTPKMHLAAGA